MLLRVNFFISVLIFQGKGALLGTNCSRPWLFYPAPATKCTRKAKNAVPLVKKCCPQLVSRSWLLDRAALGPLKMACLQQGQCTSQYNQLSPSWVSSLALLPMHHTPFYLSIERHLTPSNFVKSSIDVAPVQQQTEPQMDRWEFPERISWSEDGAWPKRRTEHAWIRFRND